MTTVKQPRIKNGVRPTGDDGKTSLIKGERIPKSHKAIRVYGSNERFSNDLQLFIFKYGSLYGDESLNILEEEDVEILTWLVINLNNLSAFCYWKGEKSDFCFPETFLDYLNKRIDYFQSHLDDCKDFLTFTDEKYILLDRCRISARQVESEFTAWREFCFGKLDYKYKKWNPLYWLQKLRNRFKNDNEDVILMASILNRLSGYIWNLNRYLMLKNKVEERHWSGGVMKFK